MQYLIRKQKKEIKARSNNRAKDERKNGKTIRKHHWRTKREKSAKKWIIKNNQQIKNKSGIINQSKIRFSLIFNKKTIDFRFSQFHILRFLSFIHHYSLFFPSFYHKYSMPNEYYSPTVFKTFSIFLIYLHNISSFLFQF